MSRFNYATTRNKSINTYSNNLKLSKTEEKIALDAFIFVSKHLHVLTQHNKEWLKKFIDDITKQMITKIPVTRGQIKLLMQFEREVKQIQSRVISAPKIKQKYLDILATLKSV